MVLMIPSHSMLAKSFNAIWKGRSVHTPQNLVTTLHVEWGKGEKRF